MTLEVFKEHNEQMDRLSGKSISKSTAKRYWTCYNHIEQFLKEEFSVEDYPMNDINHQFITKFEYFLKDKKRMQSQLRFKVRKQF